MALHSLYCADVPLRNCSLTHSPQTNVRIFIVTFFGSPSGFIQSNIEHHWF